MTTTFTAAPTFKAALVAAIASVVDTTAVLVTYGHPGQQVAVWDDIVSVAGVTSEQEVAGMGTLRPREETLTATVMISCLRRGGPEQEQVAADAAYALLGAIERQVRVTDTTVGGTVRDCFLTGHESSGETDDTQLATGRVIEIQATFTAHARITG